VNRKAFVPCFLYWRFSTQLLKVLKLKLKLFKRMIKSTTPDKGWIWTCPWIGWQIINGVFLSLYICSFAEVFISIWYSFTGQLGWKVIYQSFWDLFEDENKAKIDPHDFTSNYIATIFSYLCYVLTAKTYA
jgi:hypothetical protein